MKRSLLVCQAEKQGRSVENPFLVLPRELIDTILTLNNVYGSPNMTPINFFASLMRLYLVDRASYAQFESIRKFEVLSLLNKLGSTYEMSSAAWTTRHETVLVWTRISRLVLCHDVYRRTIDEFFEAREKYETLFVSFVMGAIRENIHSSQYSDMGISMHAIRKRVNKMTRAQQRLLAYHCASMFKHGSRERTLIRRVTHFTALCRIYVYDIQNRTTSDDTAIDYLVSLDRDETIKIDVRYLVPLSLPLTYTNNEMLYAVENAPPTLASQLHFITSKPIGKVGSLAPDLHIASLLKCIRETDAFRKCLLESRQAIMPQKPTKKVRHIKV